LKRQEAAQAINNVAVNQETCVTRTDFTMGERLWRSANRVAFSLLV
jgi:hypothetical protein